jgi:hypothetical protein
MDMASRELQREDEEDDMVDPESDMKKRLMQRVPNVSESLETRGIPCILTSLISL